MPFHSPLGAFRTISEPGGTVQLGFEWRVPDRAFRAGCDPLTYRAPSAQYGAHVPPAPASSSEPQVWFAGQHAHDLVDFTTDPSRVDAGGWWAAVLDFEGRTRFWRFAHVERRALADLAVAAEARWHGPPRASWTSDLDRAAYCAAVDEVRRRIREGEVYQANICRVLSALIEPGENPWALALRLAKGNPAPYAAVLDIPVVSTESAILGESASRESETLTQSPSVDLSALQPLDADESRACGVRIDSASPELILRREGDRLISSPIKGTASTPEGMLDKDVAENVMIVDLVRNDLQRVCRPGTVTVSELLGVHEG